jgi:hypothetical protein
MRRTAIAILTVAFLFILTALPAVAANPHFKHGGEPVCTIADLSANSKSTTCTATLAGLGEGDLLLEVTVSGFAVYQCKNPGNTDNLPPGQNRVLIGPVTAPTTVPDDAIKNGNVTFTTDAAVLSAPATVTADQAGCPSAGWSGVNPTLTVTNITLKISQGGVLLFTCTASDPDGLSGTVALAC